jgi:N6-adenosine-specific RNA methylase IME4
MTSAVGLMPVPEALAINDDYARLCPPLPQTEYGELKASIQKYGLWYPIKVNPNGIILDGHHRFKACGELKVAPRYEVIYFEDPLDEKEFVIDSNLKRRQLTDYQRVEAGMILLEIEKERAKRRMVATQNNEAGKTVAAQLCSNEQGCARDIVAGRIGVSPTTFERARKIIEEAPEEIKQQCHDGSLSISKAYSNIIHDEKVAKLEGKITELTPLEGVYDVVVIDPPWNYNSVYHIDGNRASCLYPEMTSSEIASIKLPLADDCVVWLWTTNAFMHDALHILEAWGLTQKTILTWVKDRMGLGSWLRGQSEHCILAVKGSPVISLTNQTTVLNGPLREHSRKPDEFYVLVDSLCHGRKLDYFSRTERKGWTCYGTKELV